MPHHQHHFTNNVLPAGELPTRTFGRLVTQFQFASHVPLAGGHDSGRHIYLACGFPTAGSPAITKPPSTSAPTREPR